MYCRLPFALRAELLAELRVDYHRGTLNCGTVFFRENGRIELQHCLQASDAVAAPAWATELTADMRGIAADMRKITADLEGISAQITAISYQCDMIAQSLASLTWALLAALVATLQGVFFLYRWHPPAQEPSALYPGATPVLRSVRWQWQQQEVARSRGLLQQCAVHLKRVCACLLLIFDTRDLV